MLSVFWHLVNAIQTCRVRRDNFADPIGCEFEVRNIGIHWHSLPSPACEVGNQHIRAEVQFRLVDDPPAARTSVAEVERWTELHAQTRCRDRMLARRPRAREPL